MKCIHLNIRSVTFIILSILLHGVKHSHMANDVPVATNDVANTGDPQDSDEDSVGICPTNVNCEELHEPCIKCNYNYSCIYGEEMNVTCKVESHITCNGSDTFERTLICRYCYQTEPWEHTCVQKANCNSVATPRQYYRTNCSVKSDIICLGNRKFQKKILCNWTSGYRWSTALALSITLGGFGADRFYLGHWQEGIGKLFSFGGLGVWTLIDVILISLRYLGPADGSLYL